jgi:hypothetical protein
LARVLRAEGIGIGFPSEGLGVGMTCQALTVPMHPLSGLLVAIPEGRLMMMMRMTPEQWTA